MKNVSVKKMNGKGKNALRAVVIVVVLIFATCFALAACATGEEVQIEKVTSASEINRLIDKANFTAENAVRDKMEGRYGALSDYSYNDGRATADIEKDGKSYSVTVEIEVDESNFSVTRYKNATRSGDSLIYTQNGEEVTYSVADKFVVEENGVIYVIDPSEALNTISIAVSDAILTENVDPENPGDQTDPENPDPEEPENPTDPENPDPEEPENPGGEDKPDPDEPENPGGGETVEIKYEEYQNFDEFVLDLEGENLDNFQTAVSEKLRSEFSTQNFLTIFGRNSNLENTRTYQFAFNFDDSGNIVSLQYVGLRNNTKIVKATISFVEPINIDMITKVSYLGEIEEIVENGELVGIRYTKNAVTKEVRPVENQMLTKEIDGAYNLVDYSTLISQMLQENFAKITGDFSYTGLETLTEANQSYFDLCMPLAVEAGLINSDANIAFVAVQGSSSTNSEWGTTFNIVIRFIDLNTNKYYSFGFIFDDEQDKDTLLECLQSAIDRGNYRVNAGQENTIISGDQIFEFSEAMEGIVKYTIPDKNQK